MKILPMTFIQSLALAVLFSITTLAHAGGAIIAHPSNPLAGISKNEAAKIYLGKTRQFPNGKPAEAVDQNPGSKMRNYFYKKVIKKNESQLKIYWSKLIFTGKAHPPKEVGDDKAVKRWVANNPNGIGYVDARVLDRSVKILLIIP